jgi:NAD(P)-dependent dehydrogenase (short-subunit alcohol dehydrogenase family)
LIPPEQSTGDLVAPPGSGRLKEKVCVVVGAGSRSAGFGTGRAAAIIFAREGARVLIVDRDLDAAAMTETLIVDEGGQAQTFVADMTSTAGAAAAMDHAIRTWGRIDVLDNNLGAQQFGTVVTASDEDWELALSINLRATILASRFAIPYMVAHGGGSIINIASIAGIRPRGGNTPYATTKGAVIPLTKSMAVDHGGDGIRVNCIVPGPLATPMAEAEGALSEERRADRRSSSPLGIEGTGWDVAHAALFLASDESRYVTGTTLRVEGGVSLRTPSR